MRVRWIKTMALVGALLLAPLTGEAAEGPQSVSKLAAVLSPAVVNIASTRHYSGSSGQAYPAVPEGSPLGQLFDDANPNQDQGPQAMQEARSLGSGFIIKADGTIVTNNHVIAGADEVVVILTDGSRLPAKVLGADDKADLAVLKIEAGHDLPFVNFGDSDGAEVGDWVMAIGNPFGLGGSVTLGIVSARNRDIEEGPYDDFIQTDAAINQGNSGGPLFDMDGKVVGINTAIIAQGGSSLGIGFAVPVNLARPVVEQLAAYGETRRGWLGVGIQPVTEDIAASLNRPNQNGALVVDVTKTGPADGVVHEGDLILEFNGRTIVKVKDLSRFVSLTAVGEESTLKVLRAGAEITLKVTLGRLEAGEKVMASQDATPGTPAPAPRANPQTPHDGPPTLGDTLGLGFGAIDDASRKTYSIAKDATGVVITDVTSGSDADRQGLIKGLVVSEVNQKKVTSVAEIQKQVDDAKAAGRPALLFKISGASGAGRYVAIRLN
ncbi:MAG: Do family serine endopeptidase [Devosia sp.]